MLSCVSVRQSVCLSVKADAVAKPQDESSWFLAWVLPSTYLTLSYKEIWYLQKLGQAPTSLWDFVTLSQTPDLEQFDRVPMSVLEPTAAAAATGRW